MLISLGKIFARDRRGATAVAFAIMFVPMVIAASAAVDASRIASARALMQSAVDGATETGAGAYQMSENYTDTLQAAQSALNGTAAQLGRFVSITSSGIGAYCSAQGSQVQCGTGTNGALGSSASARGDAAGDGTASGTYSGNCPNAFKTSQEYCVIAVMQARLTNSLFAFLIPSELLSVSSAGSTLFPPSNVSGKGFPKSPGFGSAGDVSYLNAYAVPMQNGTPEYAALATAAGCSGVSGANLLPGAAASSTSGCQYLFVGASNSANSGEGGNISLENGQPIAFAFINDTGANGYTALNGTHYTTQLEVYPQAAERNGTYQPGGETIYYDSTTTTLKTCTQYTGNNCTASTSATTTATSANAPSNSGLAPGGTSSACTLYYPARTYGGQCKVTTTTTITQVGTALYGLCPDHTLYGSLSSGYGAPASDNINVYSSAYEVLGQPPSQYANHVLTPFVTNALQTETINGTNYSVASICPNYPTAGTTISAPVKPTYVNTATGISDPSGLNAYATWFPALGYADSAAAPAMDSAGNAITGGTGDIFPPPLASCAPATNATDGGITPASADPWWNWTSSNYGECTAHQTAAQDDCALLIQPLGTNIPADASGTAVLPDWYLEVTDTATGNIIALDPVYDGTGAFANISGDATSFTDLYPGVITSRITAIDPNITVSGTGVTDNDAAGYVPGAISSYNAANVTVNGKVYASITVYLMKPASTSDSQTTAGTSSYDHNLPYNTSHQCYDPQDNGNAAGHVGATVVAGDNNNGSPVDAVANPEDGAILCQSNPPQSYALFWNDLGTYEEDDIGYWNAVDGFTCSVPATTNAGGGPSTLSG